MKTAKQMFEELGWDCEKLDLSDKSTCINNLEEISKIIYEKSKGSIICPDVYQITFDLICREIITYAEGGLGEPLYFIMTPALFQAINKQAEELGWGKKENE